MAASSNRWSLNPAITQLIEADLPARFARLARGVARQQEGSSVVTFALLGELQ